MLVRETMNRLIVSDKGAYKNKEGLGEIDAEAFYFWGLPDG